MIHKRYITLALGVLCCCAVYAQSSKTAKDDFEDFRKQAYGEFYSFRNKAYKEYTSFVRQAWKEFGAQRPIPKPVIQPVPPVLYIEEPKPVKPVEPVKPEIPKNNTIAPVKPVVPIIPDTPVEPEPPKTPVTPDKPLKGNTPQPPKLTPQPINIPQPAIPDMRPVVIEEVVPFMFQPVVQPMPVEPIKEVKVKVQKKVDFSCFGTNLSVRFDTANRIKLRDVSENSVSDALEAIKPRLYDNMIADCLRLRKQLRLSDWAYLQMLKNLAEKIEGKDTNESVVLLAYLYFQSGYKMRFASLNGKLYMLFASDHYIYDVSYYIIDGQRYYGIEKLPQKLNISEAAFPKEQSMSLLINTAQDFAYSPADDRVITSERYPDLSVSVAPNSNLIDFYNTYPTSMINNNQLTRWAMYANTPLDKDVAESLYPTMKDKLKGLSQLEAVNRVLNWVQTGLTYEYDDKVWGEDRAFFAEESLFYPFADCEDRSILLTRLLRDLFGLKCLLVYYPNHLASAVEITEGNPVGDYIELQGHKYFISDGTFIGAPLGRTMPSMDNASAKVILLE